MTLCSDMVLEIRDHGFDDLVDGRILGFINDTYFEFCSLEAWPFLEAATASIVTVTGNKNLTNLPATWRAITTMINITTGRMMSPERHDTIAKRFASYSTQTGQPAFYYRQGNAINMYPIPDSVYTINLDYLIRPTALTTPTTGGADSSPIFPADHHRVLVLGALARCNAMEDDPDTASYYQGLYQAKVAAIRNDLWQWNYDRPDRMVDLFSNDAYDY